MVDGKHSMGCDFGLARAFMTNHIFFHHRGRGRGSDKKDQLNMCLVVILSYRGGERGGGRGKRGLEE